MKKISLSKGIRAMGHSFILGVFLFSSSISANNTLAYSTVQQQQPSKISGTITDVSGPLPGVTVAVKGSSTTTISDYQGKYSLAASPTDILVFSFVGYTTLNTPIAGRTVVSVHLQEDATQLQEVRVNAGYYSVKESERTGSIAKISAKDIGKQPVSNVLASMQGRMAGVSIVQDAGTAGGGFTIRIRGQNSLRSDANEPLYIINGVPYSSESIGFSETSTATLGATSPLNSINPSDIESIEVLKDADATAIYGSRGANGVVLITTKKGKEGQTTFTVNASSGVGKVTRFLDLMHTQEYLAMREQAFANDGIAVYPEAAYDINGTWNKNRYTDWQKELIGGTAEISALQGSVSGGSAQTQYLLSATYRKETTVMPGDFQYNKGSAHFSMNHAASDGKFKAQFSASYTTQKNDQPAADLTYAARSLAPNAPALYTENAELNWENGTWNNPLANLNQKFTSRTYDLFSNAVLTYSIVKNLELKSNFGYTDTKNNEKRTIPSTIYNPSYGMTSSSSSLYTNNTARRSWIIEPQLNYNLHRNKHKIEALVGATAQSTTTERLHVIGYGFSSNALISDLASASLRLVFTSDENIYKYQAFYARINYIHDKRYIFNATGRRDGSSRFGVGKQFATFGALGAAWLFSNENFLIDNRIMSYGKLRGSYGVTGSDQIGDYQFHDTYVSSGNAYQGIIGLQPSRLFNPNFGWESNRKLEVAIDAGFFHDRMFLTAAWFRNRSGNQLVGIPLPGTTGFNVLNANLNATVQNSGIEFTLQTANFQTVDFKWNTAINITANQNKLLSFPDLQSSPYSNSYKIGQPLSIQKVYHFIGLNPQTGVYEFDDVNGDGTIAAPEDKETIANLSPKYFGGLQNTFNYKNFQFDFLFQFVKQQGFRYLPAPGGGMTNQLQAVSNSWQQTGDSSSQQKLTTGLNYDIISAYYNFTESDNAITDASYLRLKNISLSYDVPLPPSSKINCKLSLQGQNLLTITPYDGDPEFKFAGYLPPLKMYTASVQLTF